MCHVCLHAALKDKPSICSPAQLTTAQQSQTQHPQQAPWQHWLPRTAVKPQATSNKCQGKWNMQQAHRDQDGPSCMAPFLRYAPSWLLPEATARSPARPAAVVHSN